MIGLTIMRYLFAELHVQIVRTVKSLSRVLYAMDKNKVCWYIKCVRPKIRNMRLAAECEAPIWQDNDIKNFKKRVYSSYEDYLGDREDVEFITQGQLLHLVEASIELGSIKNEAATYPLR